MFLIRLQIILGILPILFILGISPAATALSASPAASPNKSALAVSPAIVEHILAAEKTKTFTLKISNLTDFPLPISGTVKNFIALEEITDPKKRALYDASKWFVISDPDFILQPKQVREVSVSITPPKGSEPGGHYATVYFQPLLPEGALTPSTAYLSARVGSLAFLVIPGDFDEKLSIENFSLSKLHVGSRVDIGIRLKNSGNVHLSPNTKVVIRNWFGNKTAEPVIKPSVILPGTSRTYTASWNSGFVVGKYTAAVESAYGNEDTKAVSQAVTFWIIPWALLVSPLVIVPLLIVGIRARGRWKKAWGILRGKA